MVLRAIDKIELPTEKPFSTEVLPGISDWTGGVAVEEVSCVAMQSVPWEPLPSVARRKALRSDKAAIWCCAARCSSSRGPLNRSLARPTDPVWHSSMCRRTRSSVMGVYLKGRASVGHRRCRVGHVKTDHWGFPFLSFFFCCPVLWAVLSS